MANNYGIPEEVERRLRINKVCAYCHKKMRKPNSKVSRAKWATIEHLDEDGPAYWGEGLKEKGLVMCCGACNSSRWTKKLEDWFKSEYCMGRNINGKTVAKSVKEYIRKITIK